MAERYSRLFTLPEDLYAPGSPLVIAAGALLTDNQTGQCVAQLKLRSISPKTISTVRVLVVGCDGDGKELCREEHVYEGLHAARDALFGVKEAIRLPSPEVRSFSARVLSVTFSDGSRYLGDGAVWKPLPRQADLNQRLFDKELIRQYRLETGEDSRFVPLEIQDLWFCACGEINHKGESCHRCEQTLEHCRKYLNVELLRENKSLRLNAEAAQAALDEEKKQSRGKLLKRIMLVLIPMLLIAAVAAGVYVFTSRRNAIYEEASRLYAAENYAEAALRFDKLGHFRDSAELAAKAKKADAEIASYTRACKYLENERWDDAYGAFTDLGDYLDSAELAQEALYRKGQLLLFQGQHAEARELFEKLGSYKDSPVIAAHFFDRLLSEEVSLNPECNGPLTTEYRYDQYGRIAEKTELFSAYPGMEDRVSVYRYEDDGGYTVIESQVGKRYDAAGAYLGQGDVLSTVYEYDYYPDGTVHYRIGLDAATGEYRSSAAYDEHGNLIAVQNEDGVSYTLLNEYDGDRLSRQERYNADGTMVSRTSFEYDDAGRMKRATFLTPGATATVTALYSYGPVYAPQAEE
ncbi:MAG: hypothetical protein IJQ36_03215 [Oscillospiraceae bacterium]|nr:hypothetical protein [Oscillospiraceae bacterium]